MIEIERKFLVTNLSFINTANTKYRIVQGYLNSEASRTVRVRIKGDKAFLTIKGIGNASGTTRLEWEKEISVPDAQLLLPICEPGCIDKTRYEVTVGRHIYEVDVFYGDNNGLVIAEIELDNEQEIFEKPDWLGPEVTGETRYYNAYLSKHPYNKW